MWSRSQGYSVVPVADASPPAGWSLLLEKKTTNSPELCAGGIKPEGFVCLTVCLSGAARSVMRHVVTAVLVVSAA